MRWLSRLYGRFVPHVPVNEARWVMLDVETSGLDTKHDRLLAIAAIAMRVDWSAKKLSVDLGDSFEVVLQQNEASTKDNILLHGIGVQQQRAGTEPAQALRAFADFAGSSPLLAFHAAFDKAMVGKYADLYLDAALPNTWLDIDHLCAVTHSTVRARALDDWMRHFNIVCAMRHQAAADTLAECELLQRIWPEVARQCASWGEVERLAAQHRWMVRAG
jgi:DNA polymerase III subunit epsilon